MIVRTRKQLEENFNDLMCDDIVLYPVVDLTKALSLISRAVPCFPSALSLNLHNSKVNQTKLLSDLMLPDTKIIKSISDMLDKVKWFRDNGHKTLITKFDKGGGGNHVYKWESHTTNNYSDLIRFHFIQPFPFIMQPYFENFMDVRVILVGDYFEAYERKNDTSFKKNLAQGGYHVKIENESLLNVLKEASEYVLERVDFPYAHLDFMVADEFIYFSELSLGGGLKGANISKAELQILKQKRLNELAEICQYNGLGCANESECHKDNFDECGYRKYFEYLDGK